MIRRVLGELMYSFIFLLGHACPILLKYLLATLKYFQIGQVSETACKILQNQLLKLKTEQFL